MTTELTADQAATMKHDGTIVTAEWSANYLTEQLNRQEAMTAGGFKYHTRNPDAPLRPVWSDGNRKANWWLRSDVEALAARLADT